MGRQAAGVLRQEVDVLLRLFPDAQIVHIVRDGRANVASLKKMPWWPYDCDRLDGGLVAGRVLLAAQRQAAARPTPST